MELKQRKKKKLNIVDIFLLLAILLLIAFLLYTFLAPKETFGTYPDFTYTVVIENVPASAVLTLAENAVVYDDDSGLAIGTLSAYTRSVKSTPVASEQNGGFVYGTQTDDTRVSVVLEIKATATLNENHYFETGSGFTMSAGKKISLRVSGFFGTGTCTNVIPGEKEAAQ